MLYMIATGMDSIRGMWCMADLCIFEDGRVSLRGVSF